MSEANKVVERWRLEEQREAHRAALVRALTAAQWRLACTVFTDEFNPVDSLPPEEFDDGPLAVVEDVAAQPTPSQLADDLLGIPPR